MILNFFSVISADFDVLSDEIEPDQYLSIEDMAVASDSHNTANKSITVSSSSSVIMSTSASNQFSSEQNDDATSVSSDTDCTASSARSADDHEENSDVQSVCNPLTEEALLRHNIEFEPMNSKQRIQFWNITDEFSELEDDFNDSKFFSKPTRSERVS